MATGTIIWVSATAGHTFVSIDGDGGDLFVRVAPGVNAALPLGASVEFDVGRGANGRRYATNVVVRKTHNR